MLRDKAFNIAKNLKYDGYQRWLVAMVYKCFGKKTSSTNKRTKINSDIDFKNTHASDLANQDLAK